MVVAGFGFDDGDRVASVPHEGGACTSYLPLHAVLFFGYFHLIAPDWQLVVQYPCGERELFPKLAGIAWVYRVRFEDFFACFERRGAAAGQQRVCAR